MRRTRSQANSNLPADIVQLRNIILGFRLTELQTLLTWANCKKSGYKKADLQRVALQLASTKANAIRDKVQEIYENGKLYTTPSPSPPAIDPIQVPPPPPQISRPNMYAPNYNVTDPNRAANANGVMAPQYGIMPTFPVHPDVRLKKLAFYDILGTLIKPSTLLPGNNQRLQEGTFPFYLSPQQATDIASNRDIRNVAKPEYTIQVQLRFCLLETSCEQEDYFPPNVVVKVNSKLCQLPNPIPTNKPGVEPKRPPRPVNITPHVKLSPTVTNHIHITWCTEFNRGFVIALYLVRKLSSAQLLQRLKQKGIKPADYTRALIKEKLNEDADCEIATTMLKVSLICPLGKMRMTTPARASTCSHLQCFDASLYLQMNERKPTWNCPVCDKAAIYEHLVIDGYFQEVLASFSLGSDNNEIQLHKDGSWSTHNPQKETCSLDTPMKPQQMQQVEVISDDLEVITTDPPKMSIKSQLSNNEPSSTTAASNEMVDLTVSDSDDDDIPLKRIISKTNQPTSNSTTTNNGNGSSGTNSNSTVATTNNKSKTNDSSPSTSVIMLDSPSPPSTPNPPTVFASSNAFPDVTSTTQASMDNNIPNYQINPMAFNRYESLDHDPLETPSAVYQRLMSQASNPSIDWNVVHPFSEDL